MTEQKHLKALVRARMARTGESYTTARRHVVPREASPPGLTPMAEFRAHDRHCMTAVFTPDDEWVVSGGFGGQARIWTTGGRLVGELIGHESSVNVVRISGDGSTAVTAASDRTVRVWDLATRRERTLLGRHGRQVVALDVDAARDRVWSGSHDGTLREWRLSTGEAGPARELDGAITALAVRPADGVLAIGTARSGIAILGVDGTVRARVGEASGAVGSLSWAADGAFLVASSRQAATVWAADRWEPVRTVEGGGGTMLPVALSPDGGRMALGWDHHVGLWNADDSQAPAIVDGLPKGVYGLAFSHDGRTLAAAAADGRVRLWAVT